LHNKFSKEGLQVAFVTQLWGYTMDKDHKPIYGVSAADELEYDRKYWLEENKIPFKVGVDVTEAIPDTTTPPVDTAKKGDSAAKKSAVARRTGDAYKRPVWVDAYGISGYPTFLLIDRAGIVRRVFLGGSEKIDDTLGPAIEKLLGEKVSGTK
jgi:hypothetical protein